MARYGYLACTKCKEFVFLGKWLRASEGENEVGVGFWHGTLSSSDDADSALLGRKALSFLARHMDHQLVTASEGGLIEGLELEGYANVDEQYDALARVAFGRAKTEGASKTEDKL